MQNQKAEMGCGCIVLLLGLIVTIIFTFWFNANEAFTGIIVKTSYSATRNTQIFQKVELQGFDEDIPSLAYNIKQIDYRYHHTRYWTTSSFCIGINGKVKTCTQSHSESVYEDWYEFSYNQWIGYRQFTKTAINEPFATPYLDLSGRQYNTESCGFLNATELKNVYEDRSLGCWREVSPTYIFAIEFGSVLDTAIHSCQISGEIWKKLQLRDTIKGYYFNNRKWYDCESIRGIK